MQRVKIIFGFICVLLMLSNLTFSQEGLQPAGHFFQDQVIRKISIGQQAVWIVKGADSTGVGKIDHLDVAHDYTSKFNTRGPFTGLVAKYGDSAMFATKNNYLLLYDKGSITRLDEAYGVNGSRINDIYGTVNYTALATNKGLFQSFDNQHFNLFNIGAPYEAFKVSGKEGLSEIALYRDAANGGGDYVSLLSNMNSESLDMPGNFFEGRFRKEFLKRLHAISSTEVEGTDNIFFLGDASGLTYARSGFINYGSTRYFLRDTVVFAIRKYKTLMLIGTEKGLFYTTRVKPERTLQIGLGSEYQVFDIQVDEGKGIVWLATDKGLLRLKDSDVVPEFTIIKDENISWAKSIGGAQEDLVKASATDSKGNVYIIGSFMRMVNFGDTSLVARNERDFFLAKYSAEGKLIWVRTSPIASQQDGSSNEMGLALAVDAQDNVYIVVRQLRYFLSKELRDPHLYWRNKSADNVVLHRWVLKFNKDGRQQWVQPLEEENWTGGISVDYRDFNVFCDVDLKGNIYIAYASYLSKTSAEVANWTVKKFSPDFKQLWLKSFPRELNHFGLRPNGDFYLSGTYAGDFKVGNLQFEGLGSNQIKQLLLLACDANGEVKWGKNFGGDSYNSYRQIQSIGWDRGGNIFLSGEFNDRIEIGGRVAVPSTRAGIFTAKLNVLGQFEWVSYGVVGENHRNHQSIWHMSVDSLGFTFIAGPLMQRLTVGNMTLSAANEKQEAFLLKLNPDGSPSWGSKLPGISFFNYGIKNFIPMISRGLNNDIFLVTQLNTHLNVNGVMLYKEGSEQIFFSKISDPSSVYSASIVRGKVFYDKNQNSQFDAEDKPLPNMILKAEPGPHYSKSDENGDYFHFLKQGDYSLKQVVPTAYQKFVRQSDLQDDYQVSLLSNKTDISGFNFANEIKEVPYLSVDLSPTRFRRCFTNITEVKYCNQGFKAAEQVKIVLEYPEWVVPLESSIPWTKNGNTYTFDIGRMDILSCRTLSIKDSVVCGNEAIRGLNQCIKATILPLNPMLDNPDWDRSDVEISAECKDNGFVRVHLKNTGNGHMVDSALFNVYLDQKRAYTGKYKLMAGETLSLNLLANGKPLHFEAALTAHHPEKRAVSLSIHGCKTNGEGNISMGFDKQFPQNDESENKETSCLEILDSFDPNDKLAFPAGITKTNYIAEDAMLEYTIRFQNTGTDVAYNVVVVDSLSEYLDIETLSVGLSSHPVKWSFGSGREPILIWRFYGINLPDSNSNEPASHGFVKFQIKPKPGLSRGTFIKNSADIFFDYNSPIRTNEVFHTIGLPEALPGERMLVQSCNETVDLQAAAPLKLVLCGKDQILLSHKQPLTGRGVWRVSKGSARLEDPYAPETWATNLDMGENEFYWEVSYCDQKVRSQVSILRLPEPLKPEVTTEVHLCQDEPVPAITATGQHLAWYADAALTKLLSEEAFYQPSPASQTLYVVQRNGGCQSEAAQVQVVLHEKPALPTVNTLQEVCLALEEPVLTAQGERLRWYADGSKQVLLAEGAHFSPADHESRRYYVSQSSEYCESDLAEVHFVGKHFDPAKAFIANVVTPNGDDKNQYYYLKPFETQECLGSFNAIKIYNRWGSQVYESNEENFRWDASNQASGVYYFQIRYQLRTFKGHIQVVK